MIGVLNSQEITVAILDNDQPNACPFWGDETHEVKSHGMAFHQFECPADNEDAKLIEVGGYVVVPNLDGEPQVFKIKEIEDEDNDDGTLIRRVFSESLAIELIGDIVRPTVLNGASASTALSTVLSGTQWKVGTVEWSGINSFEFTDYPTALSALHAIADVYPAEIRFRYEWTNGSVVERYVDLLKRIGSDEGKRFEYAQDLKHILRKESMEDVVTALVGLGKTDADGNTVTFEGVSGTYVNDEGTSVTKPVGQDWVGDPDALQRWGKEGKHLFGKLETDETDAAVILDMTWAELQKRKEPKLSYEMDVVLLERLVGNEYEHEKVRLGDTVTVVDFNFNPPLVVRGGVSERKTSQSDPESDSVVLANFETLTLTESSLIASLQDLIRQEKAKWEQNGDRIVKSPTPPDNPEVDQLWIDTSNDLEVLKRWDGTTWQKATPTVPEEIGAETPTNAQAKADIAELQAQKKALAMEKMRVDFAYDQQKASTYLQTAAIITELDSAKSEYDTRHADVFATINTAIGDASVTQVEKDDIASKTNLLEQSSGRLAAAMKDADSDIAANMAAEAEGNAVSQSQQYVEQYAETKITKGTVAPAFPEQYDLWIDSSVTPPVWKQYNGTTWEKFTRTDLTELTGTVLASQIGANTITSNMISTAGLDAGVITFGTMDGNRIAAGTLSADKIFGGTISGVTISVDTDAFVGNNLYLGNQQSTGYKAIYFKDGANITVGDGLAGQDMTLNCAELIYGTSTTLLQYGMTFRNYGFYSTVDVVFEADVPVYVDSSLTISGSAKPLHLKGTDHVYIEYFRTGTTLRTAFVGHGTPGNNVFQVSNESGQVELQSYLDYVHVTRTGGGVPGLYFPQYNGGWFMQDTTWLRTIANVSIYTPNEIKGQITDISDPSQKENIERVAESGLDKIRSMKVYKYNMRTDRAGTPRRWGLMADEVPEEMQTDNGDTVKGIKISSQMAIMLKAMQEMADKIDALETKIQGGGV